MKGDVVSKRFILLTAKRTRKIKFELTGEQKKFREMVWDFTDGEIKRDSESCHRAHIEEEQIVERGRSP